MEVGIFLLTIYSSYGLFLLLLTYKTYIRLVLSSKMGLKVSLKTFKD